MASENIGLFTLTKAVVSAHPTLIEARQFERDGKKQGEPKFGIRLLFPNDSEDLKALKAVAVSVARAKWPNRDLKEIKFPFSNGDTLAAKRKEKSGKDDGEFQRGHVVVAARSKYRPQLGYIEGGRIVALDGDDAILAAKDKFYFGVEVFAQLNLTTYEMGSGDGINCYLQSVLSTVKGKKLSSGGASISDTFKGYVGSVSTEDPTAGSFDPSDGLPF